MRETIRELKRMVSSLPDLSQLVNHQGEGSIEYNVEGTALGFNLWNRENVAIQRALMTVDTEFSIHTHQEHEYVILVSGSMKMIGEGIITGPHQDNVVKVGGGCYFPPLSPHGFEVLKNSWVIGVTIPASEAYPGGRE